MENQRRELLNAFPLKAYELWQKGERLPQPLEEMLTELKEVDERLNLIRAQRFAKVEEKKQNPETASEESPAEKLRKKQRMRAKHRQRCRKKLRFRSRRSGKRPTFRRKKAKPAITRKDDKNRRRRAKPSAPIFGYTACNGGTYR